MNNDEKMIAAVKAIVAEFGSGKHKITTGEWERHMEEQYEMAKGSAKPSDYCYNRVNDGIDPDKKPMLFVCSRRGEYICCGEHYPYNGPVYHNNVIVGHCENGIRRIFPANAE